MYVDISALWLLMQYVQRVAIKHLMAVGWNQPGLMVLPASHITLHITSLPLPSGMALYFSRSYCLAVGIMLSLSVCLSVCLWRSVSCLKERHILQQKCLKECFTLSV